MTKDRLTKPSGMLERLAHHGESVSAMTQAFQALSCGAGQLWHDLADRFDNPARRHRAAIFGLHHTHSSLINLNRGQGGVTGRETDAFALACETARHA